RLAPAEAVVPSGEATAATASFLIEASSIRDGRVARAALGCGVRRGAGGARIRPRSHHRRVGASACTTAATSRLCEATSSAGRSLRCRARPAHRAIVLAVAVDPVRDLIVYGDVIHLADRQGDVSEAAAVARRYAHVGVVRESETIGIVRIEPDVVIVSAPRLVLEPDAAVRGPEEAAVGNENLVGIRGGDREADVITGAPNQRPRPVDVAPTGASIIRAPERSLIRGLNQRVYAPRVAWRDRDVDLA